MTLTWDERIKKDRNWKQKERLKKREMNEKEMEEEKRRKSSKRREKDKNEKRIYKSCLFCISLMSAPAANALGLPVTTIAPTPSSTSKADEARK